METSEKNTQRMLWLIGVAIVITLVIIGGVLIALVGSGAEQRANDDNIQSDVATTTEVEKDISDLDDDVKQLKIDNEDAQSAVDDSKKQTKLGS